MPSNIARVQNCPSLPRNCVVLRTAILEPWTHVRKSEAGSWRQTSGVFRQNIEPGSG